MEQLFSIGISEDELKGYLADANLSEEEANENVEQFLRQFRVFTPSTGFEEEKEVELLPITLEMIKEALKGERTFTVQRNGSDQKMHDTSLKVFKGHNAGIARLKLPSYPDVAGCAERLRNKGWTIVNLTGDTPEKFLAQYEELRTAHPRLMVLRNGKTHVTPRNPSIAPFESAWTIFGYKEDKKA